MKNQKYVLFDDATENGKQWQQPVTADVFLKEDAVKNHADSFYLKGDGVAAATIMAEFTHLDTLLGMLSVTTLFLIPISAEEVILRLDETLARKEVTAFNKTEEEQRFSLYKYENSTLTRME